MSSPLRFCCVLAAALTLAAAAHFPRRGSAAAAGAAAGTVAALQTPTPTPTPGPEKTFTVNSLVDTPDVSPGNGVCAAASGACTLRAAFQEANAHAGDDTIDFSVTGTVNLSGALPGLTDNTVISGPGSALLIVRRNTGGDYRIFTVSFGVTVNISGLTLTRGRTAMVAGDRGDPGGGILNSGTLVLTDVTVSANGTGAGDNGTAFGGSGGAGGGIYNSGTLTMTDCLVSKNTAGRGGDGINNSGYGGNGGGIYNTGTLTMTDCVVDANVAGPSGNSGVFVNTAGSGGGIYSDGGTLVLTNLTVSNNRAGTSGTGSPSSGTGGHGGGIFTGTGITTLTNSTVRGNSAGTSLNGSDGFSGGVENGGGMTITGSTVSGNKGAVAGGILNRAALTVTNSTVSGNGNTDPARPANGINNSSGSLKLTNCTFADNKGFGVEGNNITVRNTIIARNAGSFGDGHDASGFFTSQGHNLVGDTGFSSGFGAAGDQLGTSAARLDPRLGPLAANGGPTLTHALLPDSPALDAGKNTLAVDAGNNPLTSDQRGPGFPRIADSADANTTATVDIGAFEFQLLMENVTDRATNEDTPLTFSFGIGDADSGTPTVTASSSNQTLVPDANLLITGTGFSRTLQITPAANESGTTTITLIVNGSSGQMSDTFILTVAAVNDAPAFTKGADQSAGEDSGPLTVASWATGLSAGPPNESGQSLSFLVTGNTNPALFSAGPSVSPSGTLTYTPAADASGSATITLVLTDDGGTAGGGRDTSAAQAFVINVLAVNDAPVNSVPGAQSVNQNGQLVFWGPNSNNVTISDVDAGQNPVRVTLSATNGTLTLGSKGGLTFVSGDGTGDAAMTFTSTITSVNIALHEMTFRPTAGFSGAAAVQITTNDQGHSGPGGAQSDTDSVAITVNPGGTLQFSGAVFEVEEGGVEAAITVTRTGGTAGTASISFAASPGTAAGGNFCEAGSGVDYANRPGTLTWDDGDASDRVIFLPICSDHAQEADETVNLALSGVAGSASAGAQTTAVLTINDDDFAGGVIEFSQDTYQIGEGGGARTVTVRRFGDTTRAITVDYSTDDGSIPAVSVPCSSTGGMALDRCDFTKALGTLRFAAGEAQKTFQVLISDDTYVEGQESAGLRLANPGGGAGLGARDTATLVILDNVPETSGNASDDDAKFVRQNYHDFLNREPDDAGFQFWTNNITSCGANQGCREVKRIDTSAAFFLSVEFRETGFLVYRMYKAAYGNLPGKPVPLTLAEFLPDTQRIGRGVVVNAPGWEQALEANTAAFAVEFAARERFTHAYPQTTTAAQFVDALNANTGASLSPSERNALVTHLTAGTRTRAQVLRAVAEDADFDAREKNRAFVLMQYFGYLRRNPNDAPEPGLNFNGYNFWLTKLNQFGGDHRAAEMVKAFITSAEYRARFGQP